MKKSNTFVFCAVAGLVGLANSGIVYAADYVEVVNTLSAKQDDGHHRASINWTQGVLHATGFGVPPQRYLKYPARARAMAIRAAKVDALRNLLEQTKGVQVDSQTLMKDNVIDSDLVHTVMSGQVGGASVVGSPHYMEDGSVEVEMAINFRDNFAAKAVASVRRKEKLSSVDGVKEIPAPHSTSAPDQSDATITGLVIDARNLHLKSSLAPRILAEDGRVLFSALLAGESHAKNLVAYDSKLNDAQHLSRVGDHPIVIKATKTQDISDVVISNQDAAKLDAAGGFNSVVRNAHVAIVL